MCTIQRVCSVKNIRICHPQEPSSARSSKSDANTLVSNKVLDTDPGPSISFSFNSVFFFFIYISSSDDNCPVCSVLKQLHALIEYETSHQADRAVSQFQTNETLKFYFHFPVPLKSVLVLHQVDKLNDERNWRRGLRVRPVLRRSVTEAHSFIGSSPISEL